jgi:cell wall-associated NlpC family hydrolase
MVRRTARVLAVFVVLAVGLQGGGAYAQSAGASVHVVEPGETLWQIAIDAGTNTATLMKLNDMAEGDLLVAGRSLKLPTGAAPSAAPAPTKKTYVVAEGDTLWSIAEQFGTSTAGLIEANQLEEPDRLRLGAELVVPNGGAAAPAPAAPAQPAAAPAPAAAPVAAATTASRPHKSITVPYTVQQGETLGGIARQFDVRADAIAQASGLEDANRISVGAVLKVPLPGYEHIVKQGETLRDIALQAKVDLGSLIDFNSLEDPELIRVDQVILVPAPAPSLQAATASTQPAATSTQPAAPKPTAAAAPEPPKPAPAPKPSAPPAQPAPRPAPAPPAGAPTEGLAGAAVKLLGAPYVWGGSSPSGFDCSGFVWYATRQAGKSIGRGLMGQYNSGGHPSRDDLKPGDLVFFQNTYTPGVSHNGIYLGNGQFVHAADEQSGVTISSLGSAYWSSHWYGATRLP